MVVYHKNKIDSTSTKNALRRAIGLDITSRLNNSEKLYTNPKELGGLYSFYKRERLIGNNLKFSIGDNFIQGFKKYLHKNVPKYLKSVEFSNYLYSFLKGKTSFYNADRLRNEDVRSLISKYVLIENEIKKAFDNSSLNNKGLRILNYFTDGFSGNLVNSLNITNEEFNTSLFWDEYKKKINFSNIGSNIKKTAFNSILKQIKYDNIVNETFAKALERARKNKKGREFLSSFKYHNPYFLKSQTMEDLSEFAKDYFDKSFFEDLTL